MHGPAYVLVLDDVATASGTPPASRTAGGDVIDGGGDVDRAFGQGGDDRLAGGTGEDYLEGNDGSDRLSGQDDADDWSAARPPPTRCRSAAPAAGCTQVLSAAPYDASAPGWPTPATCSPAGRATTSRSATTAGSPGRPSRDRDIALTDEDGRRPGDRRGRRRRSPAAATTTGSSAVTPTTRSTPGAGADHVEGNSGADGLVGGADSDTVIGGSRSARRATARSARCPSRTIADGNDGIYGDEPGDDVVAPDLLLGDNATVLVLDTGRAVVQLADVALRGAAPVGTSGDDTVDGGGADASGAGAPDRVFGQGGDDTITTGTAGDYVEGNSGADVVRSGAGEDDVVGGSSAGDGRPLGLRRHPAARVGSCRASTPPRRESSTTRTRCTAAWATTRCSATTAGSPAGTGAWRGGPRRGDGRHGERGDVRLRRAVRRRGPRRPLRPARRRHRARRRRRAARRRRATTPLLGDLAGREADAGARPVRAQDARRSRASWSARRCSRPARSCRRPGCPAARPATVARTWPSVAPATTSSTSVAAPTSANGETGNDVVFGGDGNDGLWGGLGHDRIFGGYGADDLDLKTRCGRSGGLRPGPRPARTTTARSPRPTATTSSTAAGVRTSCRPTRAPPVVRRPRPTS